MYSFSGFFLGTPDCLDDTDELYSEANLWCAIKANDRLFCDEHLCHDRFSCGDGSCVDTFTRYPFQRSISQKTLACFTLRNVAHMCELWYEFPMWTLPDGSCWAFPKPYKEEVNKQNVEEYCIYIVRCALSNGHEEQCPCGRVNHTDTCAKRIQDSCPSPEIVYPRRSVIRPYIHSIYFRNRTDWRLDKTPDIFIIAGSVRCRGYQATTPPGFGILINYGLQMQYNFHLMERCRFEYRLCQSEIAVRNESISAPHIHPTCWATDAIRLNKYAFNDICIESRECVSNYRAQDGFWDCGEGEDHTYGWQPANISCPPHIRKHRLICDDKCLVVKRMGDGLSHCSNHYDEFFLKSGRRILEVACQPNNYKGCHTVRQYLTSIQQGDKPE